MNPIEIEEMEEIRAEPILSELPCPLNFRMFKSCVCMTCKYNTTCPMELQCRNEGCERSHIAGCTHYTNEEDIYAQEKRTVFKPGHAYEPSVFRLGGGKSKGDPGF